MPCVEWRWLGAAVALLAAGCAGPTLEPGAAPEFLVEEAGVAFYRLGPQQAAPPEKRLEKGLRLRMLRREFGFSFVLLPTGETGYVANQALGIAPEQSPVPPAPSLPDEVGEPIYREAVFEEPLPGPDLDAPPEDAPRP